MLMISFVKKNIFLNKSVNRSFILILYFYYFVINIKIIDIVCIFNLFYSCDKDFFLLYSLDVVKL